MFVAFPEQKAYSSNRSKKKEELNMVGNNNITDVDDMIYAEHPDTVASER